MKFQYLQMKNSLYIACISFLNILETYPRLTEYFFGVDIFEMCETFPAPTVQHHNLTEHYQLGLGFHDVPLKYLEDVS